ncbi:MAG: Eco57I restriction-modification methylase domain-containing protein, partial [Longimicrobiales bacterium]
EVWRDKAREAGTRARDALRDGVEAALFELGKGFLAHPANSALGQKLSYGELSPTDYFNELLRLVYRMIFLLTIEEREILHGTGVTPEARALYGEGYGLRRLRERAVRRSQHDRHTDLWESLRPVFTALGRPGGEATLGLPGLGGLFAATQCPHLDAATLENHALLGAVFRLAWLREDAGLTRVNWKDMGPEELGSVYESLLELVPRITDDARAFAFASPDEAAGNERKMSGSYYTPDSLVQELLDTALEPVIAQRMAAQANDPENAILCISVIDPACGSGHFLLAAARRLATHLARVRTGGTPGASEYRHALRDVVTHCIHGVDRNPMALELARMSLWLETFTPDRALGFLDHHLVLGDALLGLLDLSVLKEGIPDVAFKALTGDDREVVSTLKRLNRAGRKAMAKIQKHGLATLALGTQTLSEAFTQLDQLSDDAIENVEAKRARYDALRAQAAASPLALAAEVYLGAFLMPKRVAPGERLTDRGAIEQFPMSGTLMGALDGTLGGDHSVVKHARMVCRTARVMHWQLAFPQVFARGGFDVVLGNPPWERLRLLEQEFFASRDEGVARARNKAERQRRIDALAEAPIGSPARCLFEDFIQAKHSAEAASLFCHSSGRYRLTGTGDVNTYALFAETIQQLIRPKGRAGFIAPSGLVTENTTKAFFSYIMNRRMLETFFEFENEGFFPTAGQGHMLRFALVTLVGSELTVACTKFLFQGTALSELADNRRAFALSAADIALLNPNTRTCPIFISIQDAELTKSLYRHVPVLIRDATADCAESNPWEIQFLRMFDMSIDSPLFKVKADLESTGYQQRANRYLGRAGGVFVPLYEAKMVHLYNHRHGDYTTIDSRERPHVLPPVPTDLLKSPEYLTSPFYWVPHNDVRERLSRMNWQKQWLVGWRDVTDARASERTVVACVLPWCGVGNTFCLMLPRVEDDRLIAALIADQASLIHDYVARQKVSGLHLTYETKKHLATLPPDLYTAANLAFIVPRVLELTYTADDMTPWARDLGYDGTPFPWDSDRRALLRAELDAYYARLYGLARDELRYVLDPADVMGLEYPSQTFRVLKQSEERMYGEYRTRRLVLDAWDRIASVGITNAPILAP